MTKRQHSWRGMIGWCLLGLGGPAFAACGISGGGAAISFGGYNPLTFQGKLVSADVDSSGSISVTCTGLTQGVAYTLKLGSGRSNIISARRMGGSAGGADMSYNLYTNAARSVVWGDGSSGSVISGSLGVGTNSNNHAFYGRIPGGQHSVIPGSFSDQLLITLEYAP
jgi:spore coat protein U-like protein